MKTPFACTVALGALLAAGGVQAGSFSDEGLDVTEIEPIDMDIVRQPDGTVTTQERYVHPDGSVVTRTTVREPAVGRLAPVVAVDLTPAQRRLIWHTVAVPARADAGDLPPELADLPLEPVREHIEAVPGPRPYDVGSRIPSPSSLQPLPEAVTVAVPSVQDHLYAVVGERVLLVDPLSNKVVAEVIR